MERTKKNACRTLCRCLTGALGQTLAWSDLPASPAEWEKVLRLSSAHLVTPQLRWALREQRLYSTLPTDVAEYLEAIYTLNLEKNGHCEEQLAHFIQALNCVGVRPLLLKGAAVIVGGLYPTSGERIVTDIDVLIPSSRLPEILSQLAGVGYQLLSRDGNMRKIGEPETFSHHHYPPLFHPDWPVTVELHVHPVSLHYGQLLGNDEMIRDATTLTWHGGECLLPAPSHLIVHNIIHAFLHDTRYAMRTTSLRQSFEFVLVSRAYGNRIDWDAIRQRFEMLGYGSPMRQYLALANACFGLPLTTAITIDRADQARIKLDLIRLNLEGSLALWVVNFLCQAIYRLQVLLRNPSAIKRLLDADFYLKLRDSILP